MNIKSILIWFGLFASVSAMPAPATTFDYNVNLALTSTDSITGVITTDCNSCSLASGDFLALNLNVSTGSSSYSVPTFPTTTERALVFGTISDFITATPTGLFFNFSATTTPQFGALYLYDDIAGIGVYSALDPNTITFCSGQCAGQGIGVPGVGLVTEIGNFEFATSAVPEPSTWAMMILGFCGLGFMAYRRKNGGVAPSLIAPASSYRETACGRSL